MSSAAILPWILVFPLIGFLVERAPLPRLAFEAGREGRSEGPARTRPRRRAEGRRTPSASRRGRRPRPHARSRSRRHDRRRRARAARDPVRRPAHDHRSGGLRAVVPHGGPRDLRVVGRDPRPRPASSRRSGPGSRWERPRRGSARRRSSIDVAFRIDALSALMLFFVTFIGTLIHVYSVGYMGHDPGYGRYFSYLNLFMFAMLTLVLGANLPILFVGWEGVGLCSYLLIGFYWTKTWAADAGKKAFVVNRIGDFGFVLGIFGCFALFGTVDFDRMFALAAADPGRYAAGGLLTAICLVPLRRGVRQERPDSALRLAAGRDGRPDAGLGAHPRGHDGHGRRLHGRALQRLLPHLARMGAQDARRERERVGPPDARRLVRRGGRRRRDGALRRDDGPRADGHQEGPRVLHGLAARLHVPRLRRARLLGGHFPRLHARVVQGLPLPRIRIGHPRPLRRAGHDEDGRAPQADPAHVRHDAHRDARDRGRSRASRASSRRTRSWPRRGARATRCSGSSPS